MITGNSNNNGFTLIELLITLVVLGILIAVAVPNMQGTVKSNSVRSLHSSMLNSLSYARSEAVSRNKVVTICPSSDDGASCSGSWSDGWLVFVDNANGNTPDGIFDEGEVALRVFNNRGASQVTMSDPEDSSAMTSLSWNYRGFIHGDNRALIVVCSDDDQDRYARGLLVESSGRVMMTRDFDGDGVHDNAFVESVDPDGDGPENPDFTELSCS